MSNSNKTKASSIIKKASILAIKLNGNLTSLNDEVRTTIERYVEYGYLEEDYTLGSEYYALIEAENKSNSNVRTKIY